MVGDDVCRWWMKMMERGSMMMMNNEFDVNAYGEVCHVLVWCVVVGSGRELFAFIPVSIITKTNVHIVQCTYVQYI